MQRETRGDLPVSSHFELSALGDGVYAAIATEEGAAYSNAGIIDLGDLTLLFDAFDSPEAAFDLLAAAEALTGRPPSCVAISHVHWDHWGGNQAIAPHVPILTSHAIRGGMPGAVAWLEDLRENPDLIETWLAEERARLAGETDALLRAAIERSIRRLEQMATRLPTLAMRLPDATFDGTLVLHGSARRAELHVTRDGHTLSDIYLLLPEDGVMFMGDLGFFACQPFMADCDPAGWRAHLARLEALDVDTYVPGHGPPGTAEDLRLQGRYIEVAEDLVAAAIRDGRTEQETVAQTLPSPFDTWQREGPARWEANARALYERISEVVAA
jgi:glyoxylase-like metal-dependent hydrolase (beta-lactamase superfamily II)